MPPPFLVPVMLAAVICSTIVIVTFMKSYFRQGERSGGDDSLSRAELEELIESSVRRGNYELKARLDQLEERVFATRKLSARDRALLDKWDDGGEDNALNAPGNRRQLS